jgi:hypothetical protein
MKLTKTNWRFDMEEAVFLYDDNESYEANFSIWFRMNTDERRLYQEEPYSEQIARRVFNEVHGRKAVKNLDEQIGKFFNKDEGEAW